MKLEPIIAARAEARMKGGNPVPNSEQGRTVEKVAEIAGVGKDTIAKVKYLEENADEETKRKALTGEVSVNTMDKTLSQTSKRCLLYTFRFFTFWIAERL